MIIFHKILWYNSLKTIYIIYSKLQDVKEEAL